VLAQAGGSEPAKLSGALAPAPIWVNLRLQNIRSHRIATNHKPLQT